MKDQQTKWKQIKQLITNAENKNVKKKQNKKTNEKKKYIFFPCNPPNEGKNPNNSRHLKSHRTALPCLRCCYLLNCLLVCLFDLFTRLLIQPRHSAVEYLGIKSCLSVCPNRCVDSAPDEWSGFVRFPAFWLYNRVGCVYALGLISIYQ